MRYRAGGLRDIWSDLATVTKLFRHPFCVTLKVKISAKQAASHKTMLDF